MLTLVLSASSLLPPHAGRSALGSGALTRSARTRTPAMTLMTDMQAQMERLQRELDIAKVALLSLSPAPAQNEAARRPTAFDGNAVGVVKPTGGCIPAESSQPAPATLTSVQPTRTSQAGAREMSKPIRRRVDLSHKIRIHFPSSISES